MHIGEIEVGRLYSAEYAVGMNVDVQRYFPLVHYDFFLDEGDVVMIVGVEDETSHLPATIKLLGKHGIMSDVVNGWENRFTALKIQ